MEKVLLSGLASLYRDEELMDVTLVVGLKQLKCHKVVLAASSPYFRAMFTGGLSERTSERIEIQMLSSDVVKHIVDYMYTSDISITEENVQDIFTTASLFNMMQLCDKCADFMLAHIDLSNCIQLYQLGSIHNCRLLVDSAQKIIMKEIETLLLSPEMFSLGVIELSRLIMDDKLNISKEEDLCDMILTWAARDETRPYLEHLFKHIRLPLLAPDYIQDLQDNVIITQDEACSRIIRQYISSLPNDSRFKIRRHGMYRIPLLVFVSGGEDRDSRSFGCYDPVTKSNFWTINAHPKFDFKYKIDYHRLVTGKDGNVYLSGGVFFEDYIDYNFESARALSEVRKYDIEKAGWEQVSSMKEPRCAHACVSFKNHLYAIGGKSYFPLGSPLDSVERYALDEKSWVPMSQMPIDLYHHSACVHGDNIYVIGGISTSDICAEYEMRDGDINGEVITNIFMSFSPDHDTWCILSTCMNIPRCEFGSVVSNGSLYIIGGSEGQLMNSTEVFNFSKNSWSYGPSFPDNRKCIVGAEFDGVVYACGGIRTVMSRQNQEERMVEVKDLWKLKSAMGEWEQDVRLVQFTNVHGFTTATINTQFLRQSEFISSMRRFSKR